MPKYYVNNKILFSKKKLVRLEDFLEKAGYSSKNIYVITETGKEYRNLDDIVEINEGDQFNIDPLRHEIIRYEVNGVNQQTAHRYLDLETILRKAGRDAGIDLDKLQQYRLENLTKLDRYYKLEDTIEVKNNDKFVAIYVGAVPVA